MRLILSADLDQTDETTHSWSIRGVSQNGIGALPALWKNTIDGHRAAVRTAVLDAIGALMHEGGPERVTMVAIAKRAGIGRAALYRYFPDAKQALEAWHDDLVGRHIEALERLGALAPDAESALHAVLQGYAKNLARGARHGGGAALHATEAATAARARLIATIAKIIQQGKEEGVVRRDIPSKDLAQFAVATLSSAARITGRQDWLVEATLAGLAPRDG